MFSPQELDLIASLCQDETWFLQHLEQRGIQTARLQSDVAGLRAKCVELSMNQKKADAAKAAEKKEN